MATSVKEPRIESARGLAILLMVAGHVVGAGSAVGLSLPEASFYRQSYVTLEIIRLPLFTVISGYVYALLPVQRAQVWKFMRGKARRLLLPMLFVGAAFLALRAFVPGTHERPRLADLWLLPFYPHAHYWYLYSLFVVFAVAAALEIAGALARPERYLLVLVLAACSMASPLRAVRLFGISGACYLLVFFLWGLGLHRFRRVFAQTGAQILLLTLGITAVGLRQLGLGGLVNLTTAQESPVTVVGGLALTAFLVYRMPVSRLLARLGHYSYSIYLMHVFGTAAARIVLHGFGVRSVPLHFLCGLVAGIALPIAADAALDRNALTRMLFLGRAYTPHLAHAPGQQIAAGATIGARAIVDPRRPERPRSDSES